MIRRIAGVLALIAFALCLVMGIMVGNNFVTNLSRALKAMFAMFFVGLAVGWMAQRMLDENLSDQKKNEEIGESKSAPQDR